MAVYHASLLSHNTCINWTRNPHQSQGQRYRISNRPSVQHTALRRRGFGVAGLTLAVGDEQGAETNGSSTLFEGNPQFAAALQTALKRRGKDALTQGAKVDDEKKLSPAEEVLTEALRQARRNVLRLEDLKKRVEAAIQQEERQFERIHFGLRRATADAAYIRTLTKLLAEEKEKNTEPSENDMNL